MPLTKRTIERIVQDVLESYHGAAFENMEDDGRQLRRFVVEPIAKQVLKANGADH